ncbi:hypothetical protein KCP76_04135 [Salmonella enterica subsp. enterica serovar Weltevreden]|nr:hypothetical protein KCP76_04135 [Salmonella enterica subsp. enterica serovar Weltevreden]
MRKPSYASSRQKSEKFLILANVFQCRCAVGRREYVNADVEPADKLSGKLSLVAFDAANDGKLHDARRDECVVR